MDIEELLLIIIKKICRTSPLIGIAGVIIAFIGAGANIPLMEVVGLNVVRIAIFMTIALIVLPRE